MTEAGKEIWGIKHTELHYGSHRWGYRELETLQSGMIYVYIYSFNRWSLRYLFGTAPSWYCVVGVVGDYRNIIDKELLLLRASPKGWASENRMPRVPWVSNN